MKNRFISICLMLVVLFMVFMGFRFTLSLGNNSLTIEKEPANKLHYILIHSVKQTFGYNIYLDGKLLVHQPNVPAVPGVNGFKSRQDASKVARLVIEKMKHGSRPPAISLDEMNNLGVLID